MPKCDFGPATTGEVASLALGREEFAGLGAG
jgi:hypothetical protein